MSRPRRVTAELSDQKLSFKTTRSERASIERLAKRNGQKVAELLRDIVLDAVAEDEER